MITTNLQIDIQRPVEDVFAYLMEPQNYLIWQSGLRQIETTDGMNVGSTISFVSSGLGKRHKLQAEVTHNDHHTTFTVVARQGPITFESTYRLQATSGGTRLELENKIDPGVVFRLAENVLQSISDSRYESDLKSLKAILESEAPRAATADQRV